MIIGIDASKAAVEKKTGVENFVYQLILNFIKIDSKNTYYLFTNNRLPKELTKQSNFVEIFIPFPRFWNKFRLPLALLKNQPDVYIQPTHTIPVFAPQRTIAVCHDLAWAKFPKAYSSKDLLLQKMAIKNIATKAQKIVCVSKSAEKDLLKYDPDTKGKTTVIYLGADKASNPDDKIFSENKYFITVGRFEERKNTKNLILAFDQFRTKNAGYKLILVGMPGYGFDEVKQAINQSKFKKDIIVEGYIPANKLTTKLQNATASIFPSLYEGFGLAVIEAMQAGSPVITSKISSLPEVAGDAALYIDPADTGSIAKAMQSIADNPSLRKELIMKGKKQAQKFDWIKTAQEYLKLMEEM